MWSRESRPLCPGDYWNARWARFPIRLRAKRCGQQLVYYLSVRTSAGEREEGDKEQEIVQWGLFKQ